MKKLITISLVALLCYNMGGYYVVFNFLQQSAKETIRHLIIADGVSKQTVLMVFELNNGKVTDKNFEFTDDQNEFSYFKCRYDVISKEVKGNQIYFHCIADKEETRLIVELEKLQKLNNDDASASQKSVPGWIKNFQNDYIAEDQLNLNKLIDYTFMNYHCIGLLPYEDPLLSIATPPPTV